MYTADENLNDIEEAALAYKSRGNVFARSWAAGFGATGQVVTKAPGPTSTSATNRHSDGYQPLSTSTRNDPPDSNDFAGLEHSGRAQPEF